MAIDKISYKSNISAYGTAVLSPIFRLNDRFADGQSDVVAGVGQHWQQIVRDLIEFRDIFTSSSRMPRPVRVGMNGQMYSSAEPKPLLEKTPFKLFPKEFKPPA